MNEKMADVPSLQDHIAGKTAILDAEMQRGAALRQQERDAQEAQGMAMMKGADSDVDDIIQFVQPDGDADDLPRK